MKFKARNGGKELRLIRSIRIYRYRGFLYMETSHSMFVIKDTDYRLNGREPRGADRVGKGEWDTYAFWILKNIFTYGIASYEKKLPRQ